MGKNLKAVCFGEVLFDNYPTYSKIDGALLKVCSKLKSLSADSNGKKIIRYLKKEGRVDTSGIF